MDIENYGKIQRLFKDFNKVKQGIEGLLRQQLFKQANAVIEHVCLESFNFNTQDIHRMPAEDLLVLLVDHRHFNAFQLYVLAELLILEGQSHYEQRSMAQSRICYEHSLRIFRYLTESPSMDITFPIDPADRVLLNMEMVHRIDHGE